MNFFIAKSMVLLAMLFMAAWLPVQGENATSTEVSSLKDAILEKARALEQINQQISQTQEVLTSTKSQGKALEKDVSQLTGNIKSLSLKIKADGLSIEKMSLEVEDLNGNIEDIKSSIAVKRSGIAGALRALQQKDSENLLMEIMKSKSLAESVLEVQNLYDFNKGLKADIESLKSLNDDLNGKLNSVSQKLSDIKDENVNLNNRKDLIEEQKNERQKLLSLNKSQQKTYADQLTQLSQEQEEIQNEVNALEAELRKHINLGLLPAARPGVLLFPVPGGHITQGYGRTNFALATYKSQYHNGIDIGKFYGAEVLAAEDGTVMNVGDQDRYCPRAAYGKYVVIKHADGLTTIYGHLSKQIVFQGQEVKRGQIIGYLGKTGWATGPHVHFTVWDSSTYTVKQSKFCGPMPIGGDLDPMKYVNINEGAGI